MHPSALTQDHGKRAPVFFRLSFFFQGEFGLGEDDSHGCPQLVRGVGSKPLFCFKGALQTVQHAVKGLRKVAEFRVDLSNLDPPGKISPPGYFRRRLFNSFDRHQGLSDRHICPGNACQQQHRHKENRSPENILDLPLLRPQRNHAADPQIFHGCTIQFSVIDKIAVPASRHIAVDPGSGKRFLLHESGDRILAVKHRSVRRVQGALHIVDLIKKVIVDLQPPVLVADIDIVQVVVIRLLPVLIEGDFISIFIHGTKQVASYGFLQDRTADQPKNSKGQDHEDCHHEKEPARDPECDGISDFYFQTHTLFCSYFAQSTADARSLTFSLRGAHSLLPARCG